MLWVIGARTEEALVEAVGEALDVVGYWDARSFFTHCSYIWLEQNFGRRCRAFTGEPLAQVALRRRRPHNENALILGS